MSESRTTFRVTLGVAVVLGLGILVLVNYLGARRYRRFDWTASGLYSLSEKSQKIAKDLKTPVAITVFMPEDRSSTTRHRRSCADTRRSRR